MTLFIKTLIKSMGLNDEKSAAERLEHFIKEQKHQTLLDRIKAIRTNSYYVPDYNKPKVYTDVLILYKESPNDEFKPINSNVKTSQPRPVEFGNDIQGWLDSMYADNLKDLENAKNKKEVFKKLMDERYKEVNKIYNKFLKVN